MFRAMELFCWVVAIVFMAVGLIGCVVPILPGTTIILAGAIVHRILLGPERSLGLGALVVLLALTVFSYAIDAAAGFLGASKFGATRWGIIGGTIGAIAGLFFGLVGLFIGPVIGAIAGEILGGKGLIKAGRAGWGTILGGLAGSVAKILIGLAMVAIFVTNAPSPL